MLEYYSQIVAVHMCDLNLQKPGLHTCVNNHRPGTRAESPWLCAQTPICTVTQYVRAQDACVSAAKRCVGSPALEGG